LCHASATGRAHTAVIQRIGDVLQAGDAGGVATARRLRKPLSARDLFNVMQQAEMSLKPDLASAERHVAEAEARVKRLEQIVTEMKRDKHLDGAARACAAVTQP
jgi:hypothetical protein